MRTHAFAFAAIPSLHLPPLALPFLPACASLLISLRGVVS